MPHGVHFVVLLIFPVVAEVLKLGHLFLCFDSLELFFILLAAVCRHTGHNFICSREKGYSTVIVADGGCSFVFVNVYYIFCSLGRLSHCPKFYLGTILGVVWYYRRPLCIFPQKCRQFLQLFKFLLAVRSSSVVINGPSSCIVIYWGIIYTTVKWTSFDWLSTIQRCSLVLDIISSISFSVFRSLSFTRHILFRNVLYISLLRERNFCIHICQLTIGFFWFCMSTSDFKSSRFSLQLHFRIIKSFFCHAFLKISWAERHILFRRGAWLSVDSL